MKFNKVLLRIGDLEMLDLCEKLKLENVIVPDKRIAQELVSFVEGDESELSAKEKEDTSKSET